MKKIVFATLVGLVVSCSGGSDKHIEISNSNETISAIEETNKTKSETTESSITGTVQKLTTAEFQIKVFDFKTNIEWKYTQDKPCIVDFYADWCGPCKMVAPIMDELAKKYAGQISFYKVNTDQERELSQAFGIQSIPSVLFCPKTGNPQMVPGAMSKGEYEKIIADYLLKN